MDESGPEHVPSTADDVRLRRVVLPTVRDFPTLFVEAVPFCSGGPRSAVYPPGDPVPFRPGVAGTARITSYCVVVGPTGQRDYYDVMPSSETLAAVREHLPDLPGRQLYFQLLAHRHLDGQALVIAQYHDVRTCVWLALIDVCTIPPPSRS